MIKRIAIWLLVVVYLPQTIGIRIAVHFCAGDIDRIVFFDDGSSYCECGQFALKSGKPHKSCCKDYHIQCQIKDKQSPSFSETFLFNSGLDFNAAVASNFRLEIARFESTWIQFCSNSDPPDGSDFPIFLRNRVLRL